MVLFNSSTLGHFNINGFNTTIKSLLSRKALAGLARRIKAHKEMSKLQRLDDHMLSDIGLVRADLSWAITQTDRIDPLSALAERRCKSQHAQHLATAKAYCTAVKNN